MSAEEIRKYDPEDVELKTLMGSMFHDESNGKYQDDSKEHRDNSGYNGAFCKPLGNPVAVEPVGAPTDTVKDENTAVNADHTPVSAVYDTETEWDENPDIMDTLRGCVKPTAFSALLALLYYWESIGLMADSIAVPCMCVCAALAGFGVGKTFAKK